jgi:hypothetical protein
MSYKHVTIIFKGCPHSTSTKYWPPSTVEDYVISSRYTVCGGCRHVKETSWQYNVTLFTGRHHYEILFR